MVRIPQTTKSKLFELFENDKFIQYRKSTLSTPKRHPRNDYKILDYKITKMITVIVTSDNILIKESQRFDLTENSSFKFY